MDRFLIRLSLGYPEAAEEELMLQNLGDEIPMDHVQCITNPELLVQMQQAVRQVSIAPSLTAYIVALVQATRHHPCLLYTS